MANENVIEYRCGLEFFGDDVIEGEIWLTEEEYTLVSKVLNPDNWENVRKSGSYIPSVVIKKFED